MSVSIPKAETSQEEGPKGRAEGAIGPHQRKTAQPSAPHIVHLVHLPGSRNIGRRPSSWAALCGLPKAPGDAPNQPEHQRQVGFPIGTVHKKLQAVAGMVGPPVGHTPWVGGIDHHTGSGRYKEAGLEDPHIFQHPSGPM